MIVSALLSFGCRSIWVCRVTQNYSNYFGIGQNNKTNIKQIHKKCVEQIKNIKQIHNYLPGSAALKISSWHNCFVVNVVALVVSIGWGGYNFFLLLLFVLIIDDDHWVTSRLLGKPYRVLLIIGRIWGLYCIHSCESPWS